MVEEKIQSKEGRCPACGRVLNELSSSEHECESQQFYETGKQEETP